jgi:hypothetical protein
MLPIDGTYSSTKFQENYLISFNRKIYQIDSQIVHGANILLRGILNSYFNSIKHFRADWPSQTENLNTFFFEDILHFLQNGNLKSNGESTINHLKSLSEKYGLDQLNHFFKLQTGLESDPCDNLKLAALQQDLSEYMRKLLEIWLVSQELDKDFGVRFYGCSNSFKPEVFEELIINLKEYPGFTFFINQAIKAYAEAHEHCLEDIIFELNNSWIKLELASYIPCLNTRILWLKQVKEDYSVEWVMMNIVTPLIEQQRFGEANVWTRCCMHADQNPIIPRRLIENAINSSTERENNLSTYIDNYISYFIKNESIKRNSLITDLIMSIKEKFKIEFTENMLSLTINSYVNTYIKKETNNLNSKLMSKNCEVKRYDSFLHPCFMEDLDLLKLITYTLEQEIANQLSNPTELSFLKAENYKGVKLFEILIGAARRNFFKERSIAEDFVIQFVSDHLQPYIHNVITHETTPVTSMTQLLQTAFSKAKLGNHLSRDLIKLAINVYIRKGVEAVNYRHGRSNEIRLNPSNPNHKLLILEIEKPLEIALAKDFEQSYLEELEPETKKMLSGASLRKEILSESKKAFWRKYYIEFNIP